MKWPLCFKQLNCVLSSPCDTLTLVHISFVNIYNKLSVVTYSHDPNSSHFPGYISFIMIIQSSLLKRLNVSLCNETWLTHRLNQNFMSLQQKSPFMFCSFSDLLTERIMPQIAHWPMSVPKRMVWSAGLPQSVDRLKVWQSCFKCPEIRSVRPWADLWEIAKIAL